MHRQARPCPGSSGATHTQTHTKRECKMRLYIQKLGERDFRRAWGNFTEEAESKLGLG